MHRIAVAVLAALALLATAPAAGAVIVEDVGMAGVRLGMTPDEVVAVLGQPTTRTSRPNPNSADETIVTWYFKGPKVQVTFGVGSLEGTVQVLTTRRGVERLGRIGVGTSERALRRRMQSVSCFDVGPRDRLCGKLGRQPDGRAQDSTQFWVSRRTRKITRIVVGRFFD